MGMMLILEKLYESYPGILVNAGKFEWVPVGIFPNEANIEEYLKREGVKIIFGQSGYVYGEQDGRRYHFMWMFVPVYEEVPAMKILELIKNAGEKWNDWKWQMTQKTICSNPKNLKEVGLLTEADKVGPVSLTPYNVKLLMELKEKNPAGFRAEWLQSFPRPTKKQKHQWVWARRHDLTSSKLGKVLPKFLRVLFWGRGSETETKGLENFYPKTDVVLASTVCARNCAQCFREVGNPEGEASCMGGNMEEVLIAIHKIVKRGTPHVLITGGDPMTRSNDQLRHILEPLVNSETVQVIRIGTRMPVDLPMRFFDEGLLTMLKEFSSLMRQRGARLLIDVQINHSAELTPEAVRAIRNIQDCGAEIICQTAVFREVNDSIETLQALFLELDRLWVQPYKIFHSIPVPGKEYLRVPLREFHKLVAGLHQWIPGTSVPTANIVSLVGKIPVRPAGRFAVAVPFTRRILVRSFRGELYLYKDAMDWVRRLRETVIASVVIALAAVILFWPHQVKNSNPINVGNITRVAVLANEMDYPDGWARQTFEPFVQKGTLYVPLNMRT